MTKPVFSYDEVPYSSFTFPQTRPDRLATMAAFYGMRPASPERCRVLELGCGDGTNLLSFAYILPQSEFVGVDLAKIHIEQAEQGSNELGLRNLKFLCADVMDLTRDQIGEFDYIIAHGLFSWVPDEVRTKVLEIYSECLAPHGVGYISYNAYPGCKVREMLWDMMKFYTATTDDPMQKVAAGVQYLSFLNFAAEKDSQYQRLINTELAHYSQRTMQNIYHDDFSSMNRPFYFHQFAELLGTHGLQFLSEVDAFSNNSGIRPEIVAKLDELGTDIVRREQFIDFIKGTPFRSSLVCRHDVSIDRDPDAKILGGFYLASQAEPVSGEVDLTSAKAEVFRGLDDEAEVRDPIAKAALVTLRDAWSQSVAFEDLMSQAATLTRGVGDTEAGRSELLELVKKGFVHIQLFRPDFPTAAGDKPRASRFVQWQIRKKCTDLTTLSGMDLKPDGDLMLLLLLLCDGTRDRNALVSELERRIEFPSSEREERIRELPALVNDRLDEFAKLGLLHN